MQRAASSRSAATGLVAIWAVTMWLLPVPTFGGNNDAAAIADLSRRPLASVVSFVLADGTAPVLLLIAAFPMVMRVPSRDARCAIAFSGVSGCVMSFVQLCIGVWLTLGGHRRQIAAFAGARTLGDLAGASAILLAVATATLLFHTPWRRNWSTPRVALLLTASVALATAGAGHLVESEAIASRSGLLALPFLVSVWLYAPAAFDEPFTVTQDPLSEDCAH